MPHTTLTEHIADWHTDLAVDRTQRMVRNVALTGGVSKNGYRYSEQALREATSLYEHKPVFLDHARDRTQPHERSTRDLVGTIVNPRFAAGRIRGDIRVLDTESGRTFLALAESDAPEVGMSHVVLAERAATDGTVERIRQVISVDAVVFPATTKTLRESTAVGSADHLPSPPDQAANLGTGDRGRGAGGEGTEESPQLQQLIAERDALRGELQTLRERITTDEQERELQRQLDASGLPESVITDLFREQLRQADEAQRTALIAERRSLIESARRQPPLSSERATAHQPDETATFVAAIRRHAS